MTSNQNLRKHLLELLDGGHAHAAFDDVIANFPSQSYSEVPKGLPHSAWMLLDHMRITQWDILEFSRDAHHVSPKWPEGYWPPPDDLGHPDLWHETVEKFRRDLAEMKDMVADPATDLFTKIPHGSGQTIMREALLIADHNSYHLGALLVMSRITKARQ